MSGSGSQTSSSGGGFWKLHHAAIGIAILLLMIFVVRSCGGESEDERIDAEVDDAIPRQTIVVEVPATGKGSLRRSRSRLTRRLRRYILHSNRNTGIRYSRLHRRSPFIRLIPRIPGLCDVDNLRMAVVHNRCSSRHPGGDSRRGRGRPIRNRVSASSVRWMTIGQQRTSSVQRPLLRPDRLRLTTACLAAVTAQTEMSRGRGRIRGLIKGTRLTVLRPAATPRSCPEQYIQVGSTREVGESWAEQI